MTQGHTLPGPDRRLLIVAAEFPPLGGGGVIRATKLAKYLDRIGWSVTVVCSDDPLGEAVDHSLLAELPPSVAIVRVGSRLGSASKRASTAAKRLGPGNPLFRVLYRLRAGVRALMAVPDRWIGWALKVGRMDPEALGRPDVIVSSGPPHSGHIAAALLHRRHRIPFIIDYRDEWVLNPFYRTRLPWRRLIEPRLERWCMRTAARVVFISRASAKRYAALYPDRADRFHVVPNGFDPEDLQVKKPRAIRNDQVVIGHAGSINNRRDAATFFRTFGRLAREGRLGSGARLLLMGTISGEQKRIAEGSIPADALELRPFAPHAEALRTMAECDVLLVLTNAEEAGPAALTGKIYEYLALRRPILTIAPEGPATELIGESAAGVTADPTDPVAIERAILAAILMAGDERFTGAAEEFLRRFDRSRHAERWSILLDEARATT